MSGLLQDIRYTLRQWRKNAGFTMIASLTLALGIGATTAMFSLVDGALFRALPYPQPNQLVSVGVLAPIIEGEFLFAGSYLTWRGQQVPFSSFTSSTGVNDCDLTDDQPVRSSCAAVESTFLSTFGIQPILGQNFTPEEDRPGAPRVALLSYGLWQSRFGGDRSVVGRTISLDGKQARILGVLPANFEYPTLARVGLVVPQALDESLIQRHQMGPVVRVYGRMKPGLTVNAASAQLQPLFQNFVESAPPPFRKILRLQVRSIHDLQIHDVRLSAWLLLLSALAVLLISCANVANMFLARATGRQHELAVRFALGAKRGRLFQQRLIESLLLGLLGGAAGCALAYTLVSGLLAIAPAGIPHLPDASVNGRVLLVALAVSILSALAFGSLPALERPTLEALAAITVAGAGRATLRQALISAQVWLTVVLVAGAFLFTRSLRNLQSQPLGMDTQNIVTAELTLGQQRYAQPAQRLAFFEQLEERLKQLPGISAVALSDSLPPNTPARTMPFNALQAEGEPPLTPEQGIGGVVGWRSVTPDYFSVLGIPLLRGRAFEEADRKPGDGAIVLNQALAARLFPGQEALGKAIRFRLDDQHLSQSLFVIGVTGNTQNQGLGERVVPEYYVVRRHAADDVIFRYPDSQRIRLVLKSAIDPRAVASELRNAAASLDPTLPVQSSTLRQSVSTLAARPRFSAALLGGFAAVGLLLAAAGIYGLVSLLVNQRTREIAIRVALGASSKAVIEMMVAQVSLWIGLGAAAGILCSLLAAHWAGSLLFGIKPNDPATLAEAAVVLLVAALVAAYIPARRAARVDPMVALRYE